MSNLKSNLDLLKKVETNEKVKKEKREDSKRKMFEQISALSFIYAYLNNKYLYYIKRKRFCNTNKSNIIANAFFSFKDIESNKMERFGEIIDNGNKEICNDINRGIENQNLVKRRSSYNFCFKCINYYLIKKLNLDSYKLTKDFMKSKFRFIDMRQACFRYWDIDYVVLNSAINECLVDAYFSNSIVRDGNCKMVEIPYDRISSIVQKSFFSPKYNLNDYNTRKHDCIEHSNDINNIVCDDINNDMFRDICNEVYNDIYNDKFDDCDDNHSTNVECSNTSHDLTRVDTNGENNHNPDNGIYQGTCNDDDLDNDSYTNEGSNSINFSNAIDCNDDHETDHEADHGIDHDASHDEDNDFIDINGDFTDSESDHPNGKDATVSNVGDLNTLTSFPKDICNDIVSRIGNDICNEIGNCVDSGIDEIKISGIEHAKCGDIDDILMGNSNIHILDNSETNNAVVNGFNNDVEITIKKANGEKMKYKSKMSDIYRLLCYDPLISIKENFITVPSKDDIKDKLKNYSPKDYK